MKALVAKVIILTVLWGICSEAWAEGGSFVPAHARVVLLAGLAGDLETEKEYRDQLQHWLEILGSQKIEKVYLCSDIDLGTLRSDLPLERCAATRADVLALKSRLASTNPVLFVVWGHGGAQGRTPVFHVHGPRLTAADFKSLAETVSAPPDWVLFFRGSGSFARELAGPGRRIISSEQGTAFSNDPVGMSVLLKQLGSGAALDFEETAKVFGQAVGRWYEERNLARTEDPTLWVGLGAPLVLSPPAGGEMSATGASSVATITNSVSTVTTNLPSIWKTIIRVDAKRFPDADAVTLSRTMTYTIGNKPAVSTEHEEFIQILTEEGKRHGDFNFHYSPPFEDIQFSACEVLKPDGELIRLDPEAIHESPSSSMADYNAGRHKIFSLPQVGPGAVLHVRYQTSWESFPLPHFSTKIPLNSDIPMVHQTINISIPKADSFHFAFQNTPASDASLKQTEYGTTYTWRMENTPAHRQEVLSLPESRPELLISTFADWAAFASWYSRICQGVDEVTPEMVEKAVELVKDAKTDEDKIGAVFNYVTGLRYVAVEMGVNSFRPHAAGNVFRNQFGDCKDKANLFNALLRALKIDTLKADLVLVPRFTQANDATPGLAFNHAISRVRLGEKTFWVDTTDDVCRFGMLPPGDPGRKVLVVDGSTTTLTQLPAPKPQDHRLIVRARVGCAATVSDPMPLAADISGEGYEDYELRELARHSEGHGVNMPLVDALFRLPNGVFSLEKQTFSSVSKLSEGFRVQLEGAVSGTQTVMSDKKRVLYKPVFWIPSEWTMALHRREGGLFLNHGYPIGLDQVTEFELPANVRIVATPAPQSNSQGLLSWTIVWQPSGAKLTVRLKAELASGEIGSRDVTSLQTEIGHLLTALAEGVECEIH